MQILTRISIIAIIFILQGCSTTLDESKKNSKTVFELYQENSNNKNKVINKHRVIGNNYIRNSHSELENNFPTLPNPTLYMFVYPHLVGNSHPVPGYTTKFKLYEVDHYALPNEIY
jgi:conjugative transfer region lipoprotein (TIGR03751 family)